MNFPQFWARGRSGDFLVWRWSFQSLSEAQSLADRAAEQLVARFRSGDYPLKHGGYYPDRPFREQILQEVKTAAGETSAVVTRNSYGCTVLNTARVMFVDIDLPEPKKTGGFFSKLFGKSEIAPPSTARDQAMARIEHWTRNNSEWGWRVYRTRSGIRLLATNQLVEATSDLSAQVFDDLGADLLYRKLCKSQNCFRARLTPKPWRCGVYQKPQRWPWLDSKIEKRFQKWETEYQRCAADWATCAVVQHVGNPTVHPDVQAILKMHDEPTRAESKLPLA